jgi:hypothetical protein
MFIQGGLEFALSERTLLRSNRDLDAEGDAIPVAAAESEALEGHKRWTKHLLACRLIELEVVRRSPSRACVKHLEAA